MRILSAFLVSLFFIGDYAKADNTLIEFRRAEAWDIRCIDRGNIGTIVCELYLVMNYVPHPDFRAMVMIISLPEDGHRVQIDYETQTQLREIIHHNDQPKSRVILQSCGSPCVLNRAESETAIGLIRGNKPALIKITDHGREEFEVPVDLEGLESGLQWLAEMQEKYR